MAIKKTLVFSLAASLAFIFSLPASAGHKVTENTGEKTQILMPTMDPERGKKLFVSKGCVSCHSINGVGGTDAPAMDDHTKLGQINLFDFAAKMWNHAPGMLAAQEEELGGQIYFTGDELADIIAFVHNDKVQHTFSEKDLPKEALEKMGHGKGGKSALEDHSQDAGHTPPEKK